MRFRLLSAFFAPLVLLTVVPAQPVGASAQASQASGRLSGLVEDETGNPFPAARVRLVDDAGATAAEVTTNSHGRYTVDAPRRTYRVEVEAQEHGQPVRARIKAVAIGDDTPLDIAVVGGPGHVSHFEGTVTDPNGKPLPQAVVFLGSRRATTTATDSAGSFHIDMQSGTYALRIEGSLPNDSYFYADTAFDLTHDRRQGFTLSPSGGAIRAADSTSSASPSPGRTASGEYTVSGTVLGPGGSPLAGVQVTLGSFSYSWNGTGADGRYTVSGWDGSTALNVAWVDGNPTGEYCWADWDCQGDDYVLTVDGFHPESAPQPLDLHLPPGTFTVTVVDSAGRPVEGAVVTGDSSAPSDSPGGELFPGGPVSGRIHSRRITGADGTATMPMIPGHPPVLHVDPPSDRGLPADVTPPGSATSAEVRVPGGIMVRGRVSDTAGERSWFYNAGFASAGGAVQRPLTFAADGISYAVIVPAGQYHFWTDTFDNEPGGESDDHRYFDVSSAPFDVTADTTLDFTVPALSRATLSFVDPVGEPMEGDLWVSATTGSDAVTLAPGIKGTATTGLGVFGATDTADFAVPGDSFVGAYFNAGSPLTLSDLPVRPGGRIVAAMAEGSDLALPDEPTELHAEQTGPGTVTVGWTPPVNSHGSTITGYEVTLWEGGTHARIVTLTTATSVVLTGATPGRSYLVYVSATTRRGSGNITSVSLTLDNSQPVTAPVQNPDGPGSPSPTPVTASEAHHVGYWALSSDGRVYDFGDAPALGNAAAGAVDLEPTPTGRGYWALGRNGKVEIFGDAAKLGDVATGQLAKGEEPASLSATPSGKGYWVFTNRGRAIAFGDAPFLGDMSGTKLNGPILGSVATPTGKGYYVVAADGGIFAFGDAHYAGSMGGKRLNAPVQSLVPDPDGGGYWLVASDGGIFAFDAPFHGSMGGTKLNKPISGMVRYGDGYLMVGADGGIFNFSSLPFAGSLGDKPPAAPVVAVAALPGS